MDGFQSPRFTHMLEFMQRFLLFLIFLWPAAVFAQEPEPFPDFNFKRVGVPQSGSNKRITVQIAPVAPEAPAAPATPDVAAAAPAPVLPWFWGDVSRAIDAPAQERFEQAQTVLSKAVGDGRYQTPRLDELLQITAEHGPAILRATIGTEVSPALVAAVIHAESAGRADAESKAGAVGLMQLMPATAERFGVDDRTNPLQNIQGGVAFLNLLMNAFDGDPILILAAYNAGENAVKDAGGVPPFPETLGYVPKVLAAWSIAKGLCVTEPELISDGCVFLPSPSG